MNCYNEIVQCKHNNNNNNDDTNNDNNNNDDDFNSVSSLKQRPFTREADRHTHKH